MAIEWEGKVSAATLVCGTSGRPLQPGETCISALVVADGGFARRDFSEEGWTSQDPAAFLSWWRHRVPAADEKRRGVRLDAGALRAIFRDLKDAHERSRQCFCFVVALALMRLRKLRFRETAHEGGTTWLILEDREEQVVHRLRDPGMTPDEEAAVQTNLLDIADFSTGS